MGSKKNSSKMNKDPNHTKADTSEGGHGSKKVNTDPRFASVHLDPRFAKLPKHRGKVTIDPRFDRMFTDPNFSSSTAHIDKRGKAKKDSSRDALKHYYRLEEEEEEERKQKLKRKENVESEEEAGSDEDSDESEKPGVDLSDLEMGTDSEASETDEKEESNDESSADTEEEDEYGLASAEEEDTFVQEENVPEIDKETHRLAVVNLDWGRVKAVDLYVLLSSFVPKGGQMLSVAVYPSEFGLQRMEEEAVHGPVGLFDDEKDKKGSDDDDDDDDDDEIDNEKLRAYERSRLRYYYAVVECDSIATADHLYKNCDGVEFERSSNKLDLRFIPDSMEFKHPPRDVAKEAPADYEGLDFQTRALQLSKIDLTWDEDEPQRTRSLKRKFNADQLADLEMKEFLASDESETEDEENNETEDWSEKKHKKKDMYRALLQSGEGSDGDEDGDQDMEVTFNTGLENLSKRIIEKKDTESETVWEQHLRKMKEKKKARKNRAKDSSEDESDNEPAEEMDDFFIDELSAKKDTKGKKKKKKKNNDEDKEAEEKSKAELELLLADEKGVDAGVKGYNMKRKKVKGKKGKEIPDEGKIPTIDYEDPRFSSLFKSPLYALDPTDPQFKRSAAYARQLAQKHCVGGEEPSGHEDMARPAQLESDDMAVSKKERKDKHELSSLVKSIKMKSKEVKLSACDKVSRKAAKSKK